MTGQGLSHLLDDAAERIVPLSILFELTNRCNEDCEHCYVDLGDVENELETDEVLRILAELRASGTLFLTFTGGEIFTRRDILTLIREARRLGFALRLFSNGTLIGDEAVATIREVGVTGIEMSLYAMEPKAHDAVTRIRGSWAKTTRAARKLAAAGVPVVLKAPVMRHLATEHRAIVEFCEEIGAEYRFDPTLLARYDLDEAPLELRMNRADLMGFCVDPHLGQAVKPGSGHAPDAGGAICATARRVAMISARGLVYPCSQRFPPAGNLREQSFREVWESSPLLMRLRNITAQDLPVCASCEQNSFCGRCSLDALFEDGDFFGPNTWRCDLATIREDAYEKGGTTETERIEARIRERLGATRGPG